MIQVNELRIGNWIMDRGGKIWQIDHWEYKNKLCAKEPIIDFNGIKMQGHPLTEELEFLQPIPLTPEILEKCGFVKSGESHRIKLNEVEEICFYNTHIGYELIGRHQTIEGGWTRKLYLKHLHQLQNLYYALTGEELNYQP